MIVCERNADYLEACFLCHHHRIFSLLKEQDFGHGLKSCPSKRRRMMDRKKKILIVEDEAIFATSMQRILIRSGYDVSEPVSTGEEAVKRAKEEKPDLVIMDVMLEGNIDGIEAAMDIRSMHDMPIVFISGYQEEELLERMKSVLISALYEDTSM